MLQTVSRRDVLRSALAAAGALALPRLSFAQQRPPLYQISLAQWSLNKAFFGRGGAEKRADDQRQEGQAAERATVHVPLLDRIAPCRRRGGIGVRAGCVIQATE